jgi:hypothetical protein
LRVATTSQTAPASPPAEWMRRGAGPCVLHPLYQNDSLRQANLLFCSTTELVVATDIAMATMTDLRVIIEALHSTSRVDGNQRSVMAGEREQATSKIAPD